MKNGTGIKTLIAIVGLTLFFTGYLFANFDSSIEKQKEQLELNRQFRAEIRSENEQLESEIRFNTRKIDMNHSTLKRAEKQADCIKESMSGEYKECPMDGPLDELVEDIQTPDRDKVLMDRICSKGSPMCNDWDMYNSAKKIFEDRGVPFGIALGIMNAESTLGKNYAKGCDASFFNWGGIKWKKLDDGTNVKDQPIPDANGCWMYRFDSMDDYFQSKANTLGIGYKACFNRDQPVRCVAFAYVGDPNIAEESWIRNVMAIAY